MRQQILWISIIPLTAFWLWAINIYSPIPYSSNYILPLTFVLIGIIISGVGLSQVNVEIDPRSRILIVPILLSCLVIPYPYSIGLVIIAIALIVSILLPRTKLIFLGLLVS